MSRPRAGPWRSCADGLERVAASGPVRGRRVAFVEPCGPRWAWEVQRDTGDRDGGTADTSGEAIRRADDFLGRRYKLVDDVPATPEAIAALLALAELLP